MLQLFLDSVTYTLLHSIWQAGLCYLLWISFKNRIEHIKGKEKGAALYIVPFIFMLSTISTFIIYFSLSTRTITTESLPSSSVGFTSEPIMGFLLCLWAMGVFYHLTGLWREMNYVIGLRQEMIPSVSPEIKEIFETLKEKFEIQKEVAIGLSKNIDSPMVMGFLKPVLLFPIAYINKLSLDEVESVLAHELSHIKRNDYIINIGLSVVEALYFFNPFVRQLILEVRNEREILCDMAAANVSENKKALANALLKLEEMRWASGIALGLNDGGDLTKRIYRLLDLKLNRKRIKMDWLMPVALMASLSFFSFDGISDYPLNLFSSNIGVDTIVLPGIDEKVISLEFEACDGKIDHVVVNDTRLEEVNIRQKQDLIKKIPKKKDNTNKFSFYDNGYNEALIAKKESRKSRYQNSKKQLKHNKKRESSEWNQQRSDKFYALLDGYHYGKSFDSISVFMDDLPVASLEELRKMMSMPESEYSLVGLHVKREKHGYNLIKVDSILGAKRISNFKFLFDIPQKDKVDRKHEDVERKMIISILEIKDVESKEREKVEVIPPEKFKFEEKQFLYLTPSIKGQLKVSNNYDFK